ncbi:GGDEF domain-containing protein [Paucibacter sp. AS339]|uniref:GGDEF domain-containing protein n=1 Tax=Paucibacter hankyongi TaxID=3133434 RepID=UPI0030B49042
MDQFDAGTLTTVTAVINGFMALVWLLLVQAFRIAPAAGKLLAGAYALFIPGMLCLSCLSWWPVWLGGWAQAMSNLGGFTLMSLGVRQLMRLQQRRADLLLISGTATLALLLAASLSSFRLGMLALSLASGLLFLLCTRDVLSGGRTEQPAWVTTLLALPFLLTSLLMLARAATFAWLPEANSLIMRKQQASAGLAGLYLFLTILIALGLVSVVVTRLIARIRHMTLRDPLTDTLNRRAFGAELRQLQAQIERGHQHCVVMIDVDHFKQVNDRLGHAAGDAALLHLVSVLRANMRELDRLGRLGGEEFCLLLPHTSVADAGRVAQRICEALRRQSMTWKGEPVPMTASFGVAACQADDPQGEATLAMADWQLYRAKSEGRDRVCVVGPEAKLGRMVTP